MLRPSKAQVISTARHGNEIFLFYLIAQVYNISDLVATGFPLPESSPEERHKDSESPADRPLADNNVAHPEECRWWLCFYP